MDSTHLAIMAVQAYNVSNKDVYEMRERYKTHPFDQFYPYTINLKSVNDKAGNTIIPAEYYLQYMGLADNDEYPDQVLFDLSTHDDLLFEEISNVGYEDLFQGIDFKKILDHFPIVDYKDHWKRLGAPFYLIVEMNYFSSYDHYSGATEYELETDIVGYLDANLEKHIFDVLNLENGR